MKIALASDHGGFELKEAIKQYLADKHIATVDLGTNSKDSVDYPEYGKKAAQAILNGDADRAIIMCGTGMGISIAANRFKGIRATLVTDEYTARRSREHNDSNILVFGGRIMKPDQTFKLVDIWLETSFEGGRHQKRIDLIDK